MRERETRPQRASAGVTASVVALLMVLPMMRNTDGTSALAAEILDIHLRALQPGHLYDVASSDQHTVKPWFQGKTDFSPPVPDLSNQGFTLVRGRLEVIHQQPAAAIVYRRRQQVISLYASPLTGPVVKPLLWESDGYHLLHWSSEGMSTGPFPTLAWWTFGISQLLLTSRQRAGAQARSDA